MKRGVSTMKKIPSYSEEFKESVVNLYRNGKSTAEILTEYGISPSTFYKWVRKYTVVQISETESVTTVEIKAMQKRLAELEEENMILKQTIGIFTQK